MIGITPVVRFWAGQPCVQTKLPHDGAKEQNYFCSHEGCLKEFLRKEHAGRTAQRQMWRGKDAASRGVPSMLKRGDFASRMALS